MKKKILKMVVEVEIFEESSFYNNEEPSRIIDHINDCLEEGYESVFVNDVEVLETRVEDFEL